MDERKRERLERLWHALERGEMPYEGDITALSDLSGEALARTARLWREAPEQVRRHLAHQLAVITPFTPEYSFLDLFRMMLDDPDPRVVEAALRGLADEEADDYRLVEPLVKLLRGHTAEAVRAAAARTLAYLMAMGLEGKLPEARYHQAEEALLAAHRDAGESVEVRRRALEAVAVAGGDVIAALIERAYRAEEPAMRISALYAMGAHGDKRRWQRPVMRALYSSDPEVRYEAAVASGKLDLDEAVPALLDLTDDVDEEVRQAAILALGTIASSEAIRERLLTLLDDESEVIREVAEEALALFETFHPDAERLKRLAEWLPPDKEQG